MCEEGITQVNTPGGGGGGGDLKSVVELPESGSGEGRELNPSCHSAAAAAARFCGGEYLRTPSAMRRFYSRAEIISQPFCLPAFLPLSLSFPPPCNTAAATQPRETCNLMAGDHAKRAEAAAAGGRGREVNEVG